MKKMNSHTINLDELPDCVIAHSLDGEIYAVNRGACELTGLSREQLLSMPLRNLAENPEEIDLALSRFETVDQAVFEGVMKRADDTRLLVNIHSKLERKSTGDRIISCIRDISSPRRTPGAEERKHAELKALIEARTHELERVNQDLTAEIERHKATEAALSKSQDKYKVLIDRVPVGIYRTTVDGKILEVNSALARMLGYSREEILSQTVFEGYVNPEERAVWRKEIEKNGIVRDFEIQLRRKDGASIWVRDTGRAVKDKSGKTLYFDGIMEDITEAKHAREELRQAFDRLRELESVVNRSPAVFLRWANEPGWPVMFVSDNVGQFGYCGSDFVEGKLQWMELLDPKEVPRLDNLIKHYLEDGVTEFELQFRLRMACGDLHWLESHVFVVRENDGTVKHIEGLLVDIDQRRRLERQLAEIAEHERQRIGRDLHDVLGQSLTGTAFLIKALQNKLASGEKLSTEETEKIAGMINEAISQTRSLARGLCPVDLEEQGLVRGLKELAVGVEDIYGIQCHFEGPHDGDVEDHDFAVALYYIAQEAVNNAVRHGEPTRIDMRLEECPKRIELTISDNGSGFDPQSPEASKGMGLSLMRYRAEARGAWVEVESSPGEGTVVRCSR